MSVGAEEGGAGPRIFKHGTNVVDRGLKVLFLGLFAIFVFFPVALPSSPEEAK